MIRVLDLFSGIGGFSLGLHRATYPDGTPGFETIAFCEQADYPVAVLRKHWPDVPVHRDVRDLRGDDPGLGRVDAICGGFPCQDISVAGRGAGLTGERSGLWFEYLRIIEEAAPRWVLIENVPALRTRGLDVVLGGLAAIGYDAEWHCIPAAALGAPHRRDRVWIVAYPTRNGAGRPRVGIVDGSAGGRGVVELGAIGGENRSGVAHPQHAGRTPSGLQGHEEVGGSVGERSPNAVVRSGANVAYPNGSRGPQPGRPESELGRRALDCGQVGDVAYPQAGGRGVDGHVGRSPGDARSGQPADGGETVADSERRGRQGRDPEREGADPTVPHRPDRRETMADAGVPGFPGSEQPRWGQSIVTAADLGRAVAECGWRRSVAGLGGTDDGVSPGLDGDRRPEFWATPTRGQPGENIVRFVERKQAAGAGSTVSDLGMQVQLDGDGRYPRLPEPWEGDTPRTVGRGLVNRRARLMALGNAVVPQVVTVIGNAILRAVWVSETETEA